MSVTLKQIGQEAGVSESLVSYALNGKQRINEETRRRVLEVAEQLGYSAQTNRAARTLAAKRHGTVARTGVLALLLPAPADQFAEIRENPFFLPYVNGVEVEAAQRDYDLLLCSLREDGLPRLIQSGGVDGVIGIHVPSAYPMLAELKIPAISLGIEETGTSALVPDDAGGIEQTVAHLVELGHRRIAYLGVLDNFSTARNRLRAFKKALKAHGLTADKVLIEATANRMERKCGAAGADTLLARGAKFTALVCYNDLLAMGALDRLKKSGRKIPRDVAVTGFDDYAIQVGFRPPMTSVAFDRARMGRRAVEMLCEQMNDKDNQDLAARVETFPVHLVRRKTT